MLFRIQTLFFLLICTEIVTNNAKECPRSNIWSKKYGSVSTILQKTGKKLNGGKTFSFDVADIKQMIFFTDSSYVYAAQFIFLNHSAKFYGDELDSNEKFTLTRIVKIGKGIDITAINLYSKTYINSIQFQTYDQRTRKYLWTPIIGNQSVTLNSVNGDENFAYSNVGVFKKISGVVDESLSFFSFPVLGSLSFQYSNEKCRD
jgi:hypothetical protein